MANGFLQPRGTRLNLNAKAIAGTIKAGQVYLLTDENRIAIGTSTTTYETYAKQSETSSEAAGTTGDIHYNNAGVTAGALNTKIENGNLALIAETTPTSTLAVTYFKFVNWLRAGMGARPSIKTSDINNPQVLAFDGLYQRTSRWYAAGNSTIINLIDSTAFILTGVATTVNFSSTNLYTQTRKLEYLVTTAATNAIASFRTALQWYRGDANNKGGFRYTCIWGPATGVSVTTSRAFVGMVGSVAIPTDVEPSSLLQMIGMGWDSADSNIQMMTNGPTGLATKTDLGASFSVPTVDRSVMYRLELYCAPFSTSINYTVTNIITNITVSGTLTVNLPNNSTLLGPRGYVSVGGTNSVIGLAFSGLSIQTSY